MFYMYNRDYFVDVNLYFKDFRLAKGFTQKEYARFLGISRNALSDIECYRSLPSLIVFVKALILCNELNHKSLLGVHISIVDELADNVSDLSVDYYNSNNLDRSEKVHEFFNSVRMFNDL